MNRRNAIRAAIGGMIAAVLPCWWWKRPDIVAITPPGIEPPDGFECNGDPLYLTSTVSLGCWECGKTSATPICKHCGFDSGIQPDGSFLVPPRFNEAIAEMMS